MRDICTSRTYQLSTQTNETNEKTTRNFSHASLRRMRAEVLLDVISQVTDTKNKFAGLPLGCSGRANRQRQHQHLFPDDVWPSNRGSVCSCEVKIEPNLSQALHLLNGETLATKISQGKVVEKRLAEGKTPQQIVEELYVRCLSRKPTETEIKKTNELIAAAPDKKVILEDTFWALLNSREFLFNH